MCHCHFPRAFEKIIYKQIQSYLAENQLLNKAQYGCISNSSTEKLLTQLTNKWLLDLDQPRTQVKVLILLDISKAFDCIDRVLLLMKIKHEFKFSNEMCSWFRSFLTGRKVEYEVGDAISQAMTTRCGIPQGAILGPTLFNLRVNSLVDCVTHSETVIYADDLLLVFAAKSPQLLQSHIDDDIAALNKSYADYLIQLHTKKTQVLELRNSFGDIVTISIAGIKIFGTPN